GRLVVRHERNAHRLPDRRAGTDCEHTRGRRRRTARAGGLKLERLTAGGVELALSRPGDPEALLDEDEFARDEFMPYWAELWPAGLALARALPLRLDGLRVVELGCGLGIPSLVAAARGARVTAIDWAADAIALLHTNAAANGL